MNELVDKPILIAYATREGHTHRIAEHTAGVVRERGLSAQVTNVAQIDAPHLDAYRAVILAASVHAGRHEHEMVAFVRDHRDQLAHLPTAFISVSLAEADAEGSERTAQQREEASQQVDQMIQKFIGDTAFRPTSVKPVAGALPYSQYGVLKRFIMKLIVKKHGGSTDTTVDHEYTDWSALTRFVDEFVGAALGS